MKHWKNWLKLIGLILLAWLVSTVDWTLMLATLHPLRPGYVTGYVACYVAMLVLRAFRLRWVLARLDHRTGYKDCYLATLEPTFMGLVTPGRLGEFSRVGYLHSHGVSLAQALGIVTAERLIDLCLLLVFGLAGAVYLFAPPAWQPGTWAVAIAGLLLVWAATRGYAPLLRLLQSRFSWLLRWEPEVVAKYRAGFITSFHTVMQRAAALIYWLGLTCVLLNFLQIFFLAKAFSFQADYLVIVFAYATAALVSLLPISFGGLGTREATYILIMDRVSIGREAALLFSLTDGLIFSLLVLIAMLLPLWILRFFRLAAAAFKDHA